MATIVRVAAFFLACASTVVRSNASKALRSPTKITGNDVKGNFQFLGAFCLPEKISLLQFEIVTKEEAPSDLAILFYDDEPSSFNMLSLDHVSSDGKSYCKANSKISKNFTSCSRSRKCTHGLGVKGMRHSRISAHSDFCPGCHQYRYTQKVRVIDRLPEIWYFLAAACESPGVNIVSYRFTTNDAVDCNMVRKERYKSMPYDLADSRLPGNQRVQKFGGAIDPFVPLGTLCFLKPRTDTSARVTVSFEHNTKEAVELHVYRKGVFQTLFSHDNRATDTTTSRAECARRRDMAEVIMALPPGSGAPTSLTIPTRQGSWDVAMWELVFVLHQGCDGGKAAMRVSSFTIESPEAVGCPTTPDKTVLYVEQPTITATQATQATTANTTTMATTASTATTKASTTLSGSTTTSTSQNSILLQTIIDGASSHESNIVVYASAMVLTALVSAF